MFITTREIALELLAQTFAPSRCLLKVIEHKGINRCAYKVLVKTATDKKGKHLFSILGTAVALD